MLKIEVGKDYLSTYGEIERIELVYGAIETPTPVFVAQSGRTYYEDGAAAGMGYSDLVKELENEVPHSEQSGDQSMEDFTEMATVFFNGIKKGMIIGGALVLTAVCLTTYICSGRK